MNRSRIDTVSFQLLRNFLRTVTGTGEHDRRAVFADRFRGAFDTFCKFAVFEEMLNITFFFNTFDLVGDGVGLVVASEQCNITVECGREQHRLAFCGSLVENLADFWEEAHVGHAIGFVDHHDFNVVETDRILIDEITQAPGASNENFHSVAQRFALGFVSHTAVNGEDTLVAGRGHRGEFFLDLCGEFARRRQHQGSRTPGLGGFDPHHERNSERQRFSGARRGFSADVAARQCIRDRRGLDWEWFRDPAFRKRGHNVGRHAEFSKSRQDEFS